MSIDLSMFLDENGNELPRPLGKSLAEVKECINHYKDIDSLIPKLFAEMYLVGIQWDWYFRYKDWLVIKEYAENNGYVAPNIPVRPVQETASNLLKSLEQELERSAFPTDLIEVMQADINKLHMHHNQTAQIPLNNVLNHIITFDGGVYRPFIVVEDDEDITGNITITHLYSPRRVIIESDIPLNGYIEIV